MRLNFVADSTDFLGDIADADSFESSGNSVSRGKVVIAVALKDDADEDKKSREKAKHIDICLCVDCDGESKLLVHELQRQVHE